MDPRPGIGERITDTPEDLAAGILPWTLPENRSMLQDIYEQLADEDDPMADYVKGVMNQ